MERIEHYIHDNFAALICVMSVAWLALVAYGLIMS